MGNGGHDEPPIDLAANPRSRFGPGAKKPIEVVVNEPPRESRLDAIKFYVGMFVVVGLIVGAIGALAGPWIARRLSPRGRAAAAISPHVQALAQEQRPEALATEHYLVGKIVVIDDVRHDIDPVFYELPDGLWASDASELGSVVFVACGNRMLGEYRAKGANAGMMKAYAINCRVELFDRAGKVVTRNNFESKESPPVEQDMLEGNWYAPRPNDQIVAWLTSLPRR